MTYQLPSPINNSWLVMFHIFPILTSHPQQIILMQVLHHIISSINISVCVCISLWSELHESLPRISAQGHMRLKPRFQLSFYLEASGENHCNLILMVGKIQFPISCRFEVLISSLSMSPLFAPKAQLNFICVPFIPLSNH